MKWNGIKDKTAIISTIFFSSKTAHKWREENENVGFLFWNFFFWNFRFKKLLSPMSSFFEESLETQTGKKFETDGLAPIRNQNINKHIHWY